MATRSRIGMELENGVIKSVYCHWDGYPSHNGKILFEHYQDPEKIKALIDLGDLSSLDKEVSTDLPHSFESPCDGVTVAYHRDRGEKFSMRSDMSLDFAISRLSRGGEEWGYIYTKEGEWVVLRQGAMNTRPLKELL